MPTSPKRAGTVLVLAGALLMGLGATALAGGGAPVDGRTGSEAAPGPAGAPTPRGPRSLAAPGVTPSPAGSPTPSAVRPDPPTGAPAEEPFELRVPRFGLRTTVVPVGVDEADALVVPPGDRAGWWSGGARLGEDGPVVIVGHKDDADGPAVFYGLADLAPGDEVLVNDTSWRVQRLDVVDTDAFPTDEVYGPTPGPALRLLTCGGPYDEERGAYEDNLVVYAVPA